MHISGQKAELMNELDTILHCTALTIINHLLDTRIDRLAFLKSLINRI